MDKYSNRVGFIVFVYFYFLFFGGRNAGSGLPVMQNVAK